MKSGVHRVVLHFAGPIVVLVSSSLTLGVQGLARYQSEIFPSYQIQSNIQYGTTSDLVLDTYTGSGDTMRVRPLVVFIHGGGFHNGDKVSKFGTRICGGLARRGYIVASINYRLTSTILGNQDHFEAMLRALQDAKAAVRFFRKHALTYGIDTSRIFVTGSSAGSITALHLAYLDSSEVPSFVNWGNIGGTFEGASGNPGYSSRIHGVVSNWGAIGDYRWIQAGGVPVFCIHGTRDLSISYDSSRSVSSFKYGSTVVYQRAVGSGIRAGLRLFHNAGHTLDNNPSMQDSAYNDLSAWLCTILRSIRSSAREGGASPAVVPSVVPGREELN